jgi:hypothetical protein
MSDWYGETWNERCELMDGVFGVSHPPGREAGQVLSFNLDNADDFPEAKIKRAVCNLLPPRRPPEVEERYRRDHWAFLTIGLSQPIEEPPADRGDDAPSGAGHELVILLDEPALWAAELLRTLMAFTTTRQPIEVGVRMAFGFYVMEDGTLSWFIGTPEGNNVEPADATVGLIFWPWLFPANTFVTSTGRFQLIAATSVTRNEWDLARETTTAHLVLLLCKLGLAQRCIPGRACSTDHPGFGVEWPNIAGLAVEEVYRQLDEGVGKWHLMG